ncbi:MAG: CRISPR-associated helicase Cas3' [Candidatus Methylumidiphilus sp.]
MSAYIAHRRGTDGPTQSLETHLLEVSELAKANAAKIGLESYGELLGLLHDIGKYSEEFQSYLKSAVGLLNQDDDEYVNAAGMKGKVDHSSAGAQLLWRELSSQGQLGQIVGQILALCIASHHSGLIDCLSSDPNSFGEDKFSRRMGKQEKNAHLAEALTKADASVLSRFWILIKQPQIISGLQSSLAKIVKASTGKSKECPIPQQQIGLLVRLLFSCLIDADRVNTADFEKPKDARNRMHGHYAEWGLMIARLEKSLGEFRLDKPIDQLRRDISRHCLDASLRDKGIYTLTVPTGGGKTLASLRFALHHAEKHKMDRVIYIIPFTSIIDQNAKVVREILEPVNELESKGRIVLEHHSDLTPEVQGWREKMLSENWDAPVVYTTTVQFLETLFGAGTRGARRMHQLTNAILIFDEIQTLPIKCVHLFNNAINFLVEQCGSTVILCTATQPLLNKVNADKGAIRVPEGNEIMPDVKTLFDDLKRVEIVNSRKPLGWSNEEIARLAAAETERAGSCLVIVNTKKAARTLYNLAKGRNGMEVYHLSTDLCPAHRKAKLAEIKVKLKDEQPVLCFSTQLIEAGVDIDFGAVIRFTAGLDSIAQAAGRCNRNGIHKIGIVHVVNPQEENLDKLPDIKIGKEKAERVLNDYAENPEKYGNNTIGPEAMAWYYQNYFFDRAKEMDYPVSKQSFVGRDDSLLNLLSTNSLAVGKHGKIKGQAPTICLRQSFMTAAKAFKAIDAPTRGVIVPYGEAGKKLIADLCAAYEVEKQFNLLRKAQQYTVNVFPHILEKLNNANALQPIQKDVDILYLDSRYYSPEFGLSTEPIGNMEIHCV